MKVVKPLYTVVSSAQAAVVLCKHIARDLTAYTLSYTTIIIITGSALIK